MGKKAVLQKLFVLLAAMVLALSVVSVALGSPDDIGDSSGDDSSDDVNEDVGDDSSDDLNDDSNDDLYDDSPDGSDDSGNEIEVEVETENGAAKVQIHGTGYEREFVVSSTDRETILEQISLRTGMTVGQLEGMVRFDDNSVDVSDDFGDDSLDGTEVADDSPDSAQAENETETEDLADDSPDSTTTGASAEASVQSDEGVWTKILSWFGLI